MIQTKNIDHVCLWVRSLSEAKNYYEKVFGFDCRSRVGDDSTLVAESENIHFFISEAPNGASFLSKQHMSFEVDSLEQVIKSLIQMGIKGFEQGEVSFFKYKNYKWCEWRDPSGIRLECVEII